MISNYICTDCQKIAVCKVYDKIVVFDTEAKKQLGVDIKMERCVNYKEAVDEDEE